MAPENHSGGARRRRARCVTAFATALASLATGAPACLATVTTTGDVTPIPPTGGGAVSGFFRIGNVDVGTVSITGGTPLTASNGTTLGESPTGQGILTLSGLGSDFALSSSSLVVGSFGTGSINVSDMAGVSVGGSVFVAGQANSAGSISVSGRGTVFESQSGIIVQRGRAVVDVAAGGRLQTGFSTLGDQSGSEAEVTVSDPLSLWRVNGSSTIGSAGRASLRVLNGARVENHQAILGALLGSTGAVEVAGAGSTWATSSALTIGEGGAGSLVIADGGRATVSFSPTVFGRQSQSRGDVEVRGAGSLLTAGALTVGESGAGSLRVLDGSRVTSGPANLGLNFNSRGEAVVDGVNSLWQIDGTLDVSLNGGDGVLTIANGGVVQTSSTSRVGQRGQLTLAGGRYRATLPNPLQNSGIVQGTGVIEAPVTNNSGGRIEVRAGDRLQVTGQLNNSGAINVLDGEAQFDGHVTNSSSSGVITSRDGVLRFGNGFGSTSGGGLLNFGSVAVSFGTTDVFGDINNSNNGRIVISGGAQATFYDDVFNSGTITVSAAGNVKSTAVFFGAVTGSGSFPGTGTVFLEGDLRPGNSPGVMAFGGDLALGPGSRLNIELASGAHDRVDVAGGLAAGGELEVVLLDGFAPAEGDAFDVLNFGSLSGQFDALRLPELGGGLRWDLANLYATGTLSVVPEPGALGLLAAAGATPVLLGRRRRARGERGAR